ncbi:MAG: 4-hydroxy-3-methylbut-2-enyl diphosphate reductase [Solobacterium sp.]|nr:4-hydroxy-3-methylbut-2-enyl diphosphate reductase [Solobacterium sp.]MDY2952383.1 4-hydroxy-3-methylbut-2-enyl diphosphate reductase [Erysipelotrichaceae bacterium]MCI6697174.1 4-hydroxy-3-methylbut-2-enyl diphosphate reductase [Solobacterium sp.]MCI6846896.1 4-hydroxy-3-methylbut-2-enyl diphosphate reductase [Solobacterium sp.]MDD5802407.1 4-hydroxy-3-methylbut-2-enyl diphosphate reductase [Solobacterium sp.]
MEIKRVVPSGYCKGVVNAINIVKKTKEQYPNENIYILGMIVHNSYVSKQMEDLGVITLEDPNLSKEELLDTIDKGVVIFTAHGISDKIKQKALDKGLICVDASCVDVLKNKDLIKSYLDKGYDVVYFGKKKHPEAEAILSLSNNIHLVSNISDIDNLNISNDNLFITNQTTMSYLEVEDMLKLIKDKYPTCIIQKEICNATSSRQLAITNIKDGDVLYVVGDVKSNNTNKLKEIGLKYFKKVFLISNYKEINKKDLVNENKIYVTAGASTPPILIDEVIDYLSKL